MLFLLSSDTQITHIFISYFACLSQNLSLPQKKLTLIALGVVACYHNILAILKILNKINISIQQKGLSYFRLRLQELLSTSFPGKVDGQKFIE
ncbi:hypothetical protein CMT87_08980 [Elizabethkingia anophelis]|nr:hypothetical protein [Elizabethkingia anophelis]PRQ84636.1 hypothetical protein CMT87_08980 [Elizabethkingia anophelis]PRQ85860.1 hypothetical protein CMT86_14315 [Elizabethkingia anophelis]